MRAVRLHATGGPGALSLEEVPVPTPGAGDILVRHAAVGLNLRGERNIDAHGLLVMPGGVDSHCHIEQLQAGGGADEPPGRAAAADVA